MMHLLSTSQGGPSRPVNIREVSTRVILAKSTVSTHSTVTPVITARKDVLKMEQNPTERISTHLQEKLMVQKP